MPQNRYDLRRYLLLRFVKRKHSPIDARMELEGSGTALARVVMVKLVIPTPLPVAPEAIVNDSPKSRARSKVLIPVLLLSKVIGVSLPKVSTTESEEPNAFSPMELKTTSWSKDTVRISEPSSKSILSVSSEPPGALIPRLEAVALTSPILADKVIVTPSNVNEPVEASKSNVPSVPE